MDTINPQSLEASSPPKQPSKKFSLLLVGLFEAGFVTALLTLVFIVLNYFNILQLSKLIPALSFLPHKIIVQQNTPSITHAADETFTNELRAFINQTTAPSYKVPDNTPFQQGNIENFSYTTVLWNKDNAEIVSRLQGIPSTQEMLWEKTTIALGTSSAELTIATANTFFQQYFTISIPLLSSTTCRTSTNIYNTTCELQVLNATDKLYYEAYLVGRSNSLLLTVCHPFKEKNIPDCRQL
jgi:hypothetical protein